MRRCSDCNSVLMKTETVCGACGHVLGKQKNPGARSKFSVLVSLALYIALGITAAGFFLEGMPPLSTCVPVCIVLVMIRSSADQMTDSTG